MEFKTHLKLWVWNPTLDCANKSEDAAVFKEKADEYLFVVSQIVKLWAQIKTLIETQTETESRQISN